MKKAATVALFILLVMVFTLALASGTTWKCPKCGYYMIGNYCSNCGTKRPVQTLEIKYLTLPEKLTNVKDYAFMDTAANVLIIPKKSSEITFSANALTGSQIQYIVNLSGKDIEAPDDVKIVTSLNDVKLKFEEPVTYSSRKLVIYSPNSDTEVENIIPAFEEATGIEVELLSMGTGECVARIDSKKYNPQADVMWGGMSYGTYIQYPDLWEDYTSPNDSLIDEAYRQSNIKAYTNYNLSGSGCFIINKTLAAELNFEIKGYADLLNPALKGKIAFADPTISSSTFAELTNMLLVMGDEPYDEKAWDFVTQFAANLNGTLPSSSSVYKKVAEGEYVVGVSYEDPCIRILASGANVDIVYPAEGAVWLPSATAIVKGAPHEDCAKTFIDFLLSDQGQSIYAGLTIRACNSKLPLSNEFMTPFSKINVAYENIPYCTEHKTEWLSRFAEIFNQ